MKRLVGLLPTAATFQLPEDWFDRLGVADSSYDALYAWLRDERSVVPDRLLSRVIVGAKLADKLQKHEKRRIRKRYGYSGDRLEQAAGWHNVNSGPHTLFSMIRVMGDGILVLPVDDDGTVSAAALKLHEAHREKSMKKYRAVASGSSFYEWLLSNCGRPDPVGDLAGDAAGDEDFPGNATSFQEVRAYLERLRASRDAHRALEEAWIEYQDAYPERVELAPWCRACDATIGQLQSAVVGVVGFEDFGICHRACLDPDDDRSVLELGQLAGQDVRPSVEAFAAEAALDDYTVQRILRDLLLCGFRDSSSDDSPVVYFLQAGPGGPIKIGHTSKEVSARVSSLETGCPDDLTILATMPGSRADEKALHERFSAHHRRREWFEPHEDLLRFIDTISKGADDR